MCTDICYQCGKCYRNGDCFECKNDSFYGKECKDKCFECPGGCENNGKFKDQEHNCLNKSVQKYIVIVIFIIGIKLAFHALKINLMEKNVNIPAKIVHMENVIWKVFA